MVSFRVRNLCTYSALVVLLSPLFLANPALRPLPTPSRCLSWNAVSLWYNLFVSLLVVYIPRCCYRYVSHTLALSRCSWQRRGALAFPVSITTAIKVPLYSTFICVCVANLCAIKSKV